MSTTLIHWGIPGMKWGVRRKNSGGSSRPESEDHKTVKSLRSKKVSEMSNDELKKLTSRLQLEKQLKDLSASDVGIGQKFVQEVLSNAGKQLAAKYVANAVEKGLPELLKILKNVQG